MTSYEKEIALAEKLESLYRWRRAARQWLVVLDMTPTSDWHLRDRIISRREVCITYGNVYCGEYAGINEARLADFADQRGDA
ncbi:hypothetical protein [Sodalis sp. dw_96]|uniref:hypothetical protein n=1 Tax=Sodalis sp. dw_96 TaxID=2719794 RepID=UPI001BD6A852|nr:hypothetical protein [Sodalis sp. dw_96]